ncbi:hypothetical protein [Bradyrhizobium sp. F1.13.3]
MTVRQLVWPFGAAEARHGSPLVVGDGVYKTKTEAESAVKTTKVCTEQ